MLRGECVKPVLCCVDLEWATFCSGGPSLHGAVTEGVKRKVGKGVVRGGEKGNQAKKRQKGSEYMLCPSMGMTNEANWKRCLFLFNPNLRSKLPCGP